MKPSKRGCFLRVKRERTDGTQTKRTGPGAQTQASVLPAVQIVGGKPEILTRWPVFVWCMVSFLLTMPLFAPWSWWPLGYIAFVPWIMVACAMRSARWSYTATYLLGSVFFLYHLRWLYTTTPEGYVAACLLYLALFFPAAAWLLRQAHSRRIPMTIAFPVVWTAIEIVRAYNPLGFPWFFLGHSQIRLLPMVQIADFAGVYGISFVLGLVNGLLADAVLVWLAVRWSRRTQPDASALGVNTGETRLSWRPVIVALPGVVLILAGTYFYGEYRLRQSRFTDGPLTAVLQGDFPLSTILNDPNQATDTEREQHYFSLTSQVVSAHPDIDLIVLPETPWAMYLNPEMCAIIPSFDALHKKLRRFVETHTTAFLIGAMSEEPQPKGTYPPQHRYNSAYLYVPGSSECQRYDKIHLVPFGEYVPFRYGGLHWLYRFLNDGPWNPWGRPQRPGDPPYEYSLTPGGEFTVMRLPQAASGKNGRFGVTICFEDAIPHVFRRFIISADGKRRVDFMLNMSNDGWFGHSDQQPQHLVNCTFRAIENRTGVARAVNTGVSGFIDPAGRWHDLMIEPGQTPHAGGTGYRVANIKLDQRISFYSRYGDAFGFICLLLTLLILGDGFMGFMQRRQALRASTTRLKNGPPRMGKGKQS